jgi:hypothetical protein
MSVLACVEPQRRYPGFQVLNHSTNGEGCIPRRNPFVHVKRGQCYSGPR